MKKKPQRIRDPIHNLIEFDSGQFEHTLWKVIQTAPFQRLRRIKQLGFSELVFPGATHTRFSHSVGTYHTARQLMSIIRNHISSKGNQIEDTKVNIALAASLVHDVGHGMFSHAFEEVGKKFDLKTATHEHVSDLLIRDGEISNVLKELGSGFANDVADVIKRGRPGSLYDAVVSSQFDADRLDYMQRDRLMTGVQNSGIDFIWLMKNLDVGNIKTGVDDKESGTFETFIINNKAIYAAETYILALFQLYPTVYFHKTTRGAEKVFSKILVRLIELSRDSSIEKTGLPKNHPIIKFSLEPETVENILSLDDTIFWGALPMLTEADDALIKSLSKWIWYRKLPKCIDINQKIFSKIKYLNNKADEQYTKRILILILDKINNFIDEDKSPVPRLLIDSARREPYKKFQESKGTLNQINVMWDDGSIRDMGEVSKVVANLDSFDLFRVYYDPNHQEIYKEIETIIDKTLGENP